MGNKLVRRRQVVDEKYTKPQGLYVIEAVDHKRLRKLILDAKLAPCYPGEEDCDYDLEECPICFLHYPSLNRSRCCTKGICTECFLQMKPAHPTRPTQTTERCPFCKTSNYAVEYRGMRSKEEKGKEQIEEQRVIEAKIRMQQQELHDEEGRMHRKQEICSSSGVTTPGQVGYRDLMSSSSSSVPFAPLNFPVDDDQMISSQDPYAVSILTQPSHFRRNRNDQFDVDLDDVMMIEAIWLSIQDNGGAARNCGDPDGIPFDQFAADPRFLSSAVSPFLETSASPSGGLACAVAALAERQLLNGDFANDASTSGEERMIEGYTTENWNEVSQDNEGDFFREDGEEWGLDIGSEVAEAGTSYASSNATGDVCIGDQSQYNISGSIIPESYDDQMMLAMAVSLADTCGPKNTRGVSWF